MRLAEIKNGFFGFLAQVFDSWAEFLRLRIEARSEKRPARKDPFVSSPPEHWLELAAGMSFMEGGHSEIDETGIPAPSQTFEFEYDETAPGPLTDEYEEIASLSLPPENEEIAPLQPPAKSRARDEVVKTVRTEGNRREAARYGPPPAKKPGPPKDAAFIGKKLATPAEADLAARVERSGATQASGAKFLTFSDNKKMAARPGKFVPVHPSKPARARFFSAGISSRQNEGTFVPVGGEVNSGGQGSNDTGAGKNGPAADQGNFIPISNNPERQTSFVSKGPAVHPAAAGFSGSKASGDVSGGAFPKAVVSSGNADGAFANGDISRPLVSRSGKFMDSPTHNFPQSPAEFPRQVAFAQPEPVDVRMPTGSGERENAFFPIPARKASAEVFPPGQNIRSMNDLPESGFAVQSKWAELPAQDLAGGVETPETERLRLRHMALLEREQKGERWSV